MRELVCVKDFEKYAASVLSKNALDYYKSGAGQETTLHNNKNAFSKYPLLHCIKSRYYTQQFF